MRLFVIIYFISFGLLAMPNIWIDQSDEKDGFRAHVYNENGISITDYYVAEFEKRSLETAFLLSKTEFWSKNKTSSALLDQEIKELQKTYILNSSNRLILFEFLKQNAPSGKNLCHLYANDLFLKTSESFFESSCHLSRIALKDINPILTKFDYVLIDGNRIEIQHSPYIFTSGQTHQFIFISNRFVTKEITSTVQSLKTASISLDPWVEGSCNEIVKNNTNLSEPVKIYFSKDCAKEIEHSDSTMLSFIKRNNYYIISGLLISLAALYVSSQYELAVTLP